MNFRISPSIVIMKNKKVIFLVFTLSTGGAERVASELSLGLPDHIKRTIILFKNIVSYPYKGKLISLNLPLSNNLFLKTYFFFSGLFQIKKIVRKEKPDYVISFGNQSNIHNILVNKKALVRADYFYSMTHKGFWGGIYKILVKKR